MITPPMATEESPQMKVRRAAVRDSLLHLGLPRRRAATYGGARVPHDHLQAPGELPGVHDPVGVDVPPAVRHEAPHGAVLQHPHLVAPLHDHARVLFDGIAVLVGVPVVLADHPQVRPAGGREAPLDLLLLPLAHRRHAPERHVHHGPGRLRVQPLHVALLVVVLVQISHGVGARTPPRVGEERHDGRADGEQVEPREGREHAGLQCLHGVHEHHGFLSGARVEIQLLERLPDVVERRGEGPVGELGEEAGELADGHGREARHGDGEPGLAGVRRDEPLVAVEVVVVHGEHGGRLDPVERAGQAALAGNVGGPPHEHGVDDAGHWPAAGRQPVQRRRQGGPAHARGGLHVRPRFVPGRGEEVEAVVVAVGVRDVGDAAGAVGDDDLLVGGRQRREHAPVGRHGGRERDPRAGEGSREALGQGAGRVDVALPGERHHQEVLRRHGWMIGSSAFSRT
ncbi:hypothetical protein BRADI_3g07556v3 [Brachypodium distachyon]|uniref:Uncharacterized protein n=2 Tax=Brachypodium distachyon TaxID=15368 RepID=A0A2K2CVT2_BRADI|nr:hypothetical protein BRADI_3g07556v3 [Brachypodium distachyon]